MVLAGISATAKSDLVFLDRNLNVQRCMNKVIMLHVIPSLRQMQIPNSVVQDDNARPQQ